MSEYVYVMCMLCVVLHDVYVIYAVHVYRVGTGRFPELEPEGSQSLGARTHRVIASSG